MQGSPGGSLAVIAGAVLALMAGTPGHAGSFSGQAGGARFDVDVTSLRERQFSGVVEQKYDFSCGSAAVATLLTHHYDDRTGEKPVFKSMLEHGDEAKIQRKGFSLLDMKKYLGRQNYNANGYRASLDKLKQVGIPAIALINLQGYRHFVVIKGLRDGRVLVGDPASGREVYARETFEKMWNGILFVVTNRAKTAKASFNRSDAWQTRPAAPLGSAMSSRALRQVRFNLPGANEF